MPMAAAYIILEELSIRFLGTLGNLRITVFETLCGDSLYVFEGM